MEPHDGAEGDALDAKGEDQISSGDVGDPAPGVTPSAGSGHETLGASEAAGDGAVADSAVDGSVDGSVADGAVAGGGPARWSRQRATVIWSRGVGGLGRLRRSVGLFVARGGLAARRAAGRPVRWWAVARRTVPATASSVARAL